MQLNEMIFSESANLIEEKTVADRLWAKSEFLWAKKNASYAVFQ